MARTTYTAPISAEEKAEFVPFLNRLIDTAFDEIVPRFLTGIAVDLVASQIVINYWFPDIPGWSAKETPSFIEIPRGNPRLQTREESRLFLF